MLLVLVIITESAHEKWPGLGLTTLSLVFMWTVWTGVGCGGESVNEACFF